MSWLQAWRELRDLRTLERARDISRKMQFGGYGGGYGSGYGDFWGTGDSLLSQRTEYDFRREVGMPWENSVFWIGLRWIANQFQEADPCAWIWEKGKSTPTANLLHPFAQLMNDPNPDYDGGLLSWAIVTSLLCSGQCYLIADQTSLGIPRALYWVPWWQIVPRWKSDGSEYIGWYDYLVNGKTYVLPKNMVIDLKVGLHPLNYRRGLSGTESVLPQMCTTTEAARFMAAITRNPSVFSALFSPKEKVSMSREQHAQLKEQLRVQGSGDNRGSILVPSIPLEVHKLAWSPEELALDSVLKMPEAHICASMGLSTVVLNLTAGERRDTFANKDAARREAYENGVIPLQKLVARQFRRQVPVLFRDGETPGYSLANVACMQEQRVDKSKRLKEACGGAYMSVNEARAQDGLPPIAKPEYDEVRLVGTPEPKETPEKPEKEDDDNE